MILGFYYFQAPEGIAHPRSVWQSHFRIRSQRKLVVFPGPLLFQRAQPWPLVSIPGVFRSWSLTLSTLHCCPPAGEYLVRCPGVPVSQAGQEGHRVIHCLWFPFPCRRTAITQTWRMPGYSNQVQLLMEPELSFCAPWAWGVAASGEALFH